jgi:hypothetical protein
MAEGFHGFAMNCPYDFFFHCFFFGFRLLGEVGHIKVSSSLIATFL